MILLAHSSFSRIPSTNVVKLSRIESVDIDLTPQLPEKLEECGLA
jgi:hypothetical protein